MMGTGFLSRLFSRAPSEKSFGGVAGGGLLPMLGAVRSSSGTWVSQSTAMTISTVYGCVTIRASDLARCTPRLFRRHQDDAGRDQVTSHALCKLFRRPNRVQTWFEFAEQLSISYLLRGNAFAVILRDSSGTPVEMLPINPDTITMMESMDGQLFYNVGRTGLFQSFMLEKLPTLIPAEDVFHLRGPTFNSLMGASTIHMAMDAIGLSQGQEQQASRFVGNGARPSGVLEAPGTLTAEAAKRLKESWQSANAGLSNTGGTAVLEGGVQWKQLQLTSVDLEFLQSRNFQVAEIARFFRVPLGKLGVTGATATKITPVEEEQSYVNNTVMPDLVRWEQKFAQMFDLDADDLEVDMDEGQLLRADTVTRYTAARMGVMTGILTPNEVRRSEGLPPAEGGDKLMLPVNLASLGSDITGTAPDNAGRPPAGQLPPGGVPDHLPVGDDQANTNQQGELGYNTPRHRTNASGGAARRPFKRTFNPDQPRDNHGRWSISSARLTAWIKSVDRRVATGKNPVYMVRRVGQLPDHVVASLAASGIHLAEADAHISTKQIVHLVRSAKAGKNVPAEILGNVGGVLQTATAYYEHDSGNLAYFVPVPGDDREARITVGLNKEIRIPPGPDHDRYTRVTNGVWSGTMVDSSLKNVRVKFWKI